MPTLQGTSTTAVSIAPGNCKLGRIGGFQCDTPPGSEIVPALLLFQWKLDLLIRDLFGGRIDTVRSFSDFSHPNPFNTGLQFQAFKANFILGNILAIEKLIIFSPNIVQFFRKTNEVRAFGFRPSQTLVFRKSMTTLELGVSAATFKGTLKVSDLRDSQTASSEIVAGARLETSFETREEVKFSSQMRFGLKPGVECFANCTGGPVEQQFKLNQDAVVRGLAFEDWNVSVSNLTLSGFDIQISSSVTAKNDFTGVNFSLSRSVQFANVEARTSSRWFLSDTLEPGFAGATVVFPGLLSPDTALRLGWTRKQLFPPEPTLEPTIKVLNLETSDAKNRLNLQFSPAGELTANATFKREGFQFRSSVQLVTPQDKSNPYELRTIGAVLSFQAFPFKFRLFGGVSTIAHRGILHFESKLSF